MHNIQAEVVRKLPRISIGIGGRIRIHTAYIVAQYPADQQIIKYSFPNFRLRLFGLEILGAHRE
jgi:hypothetical protein